MAHTPDLGLCKTNLDIKGDQRQKWEDYPGQSGKKGVTSAAKSESTVPSDSISGGPALLEETSLTATARSDAWAVGVAYANLAQSVKLTINRRVLPDGRRKFVKVCQTVPNKRLTGPEFRCFSLSRHRDGVWPRLAPFISRT